MELLGKSIYKSKLNVPDFTRSQNQFLQPNNYTNNNFGSEMFLNLVSKKYLQIHKTV